MRNRVKDLAALPPVHAQATVLFVYWTLDLVDCDASSGQVAVPPPKKGFSQTVGAFRKVGFVWILVCKIDTPV